MQTTPLSANTIAPASSRRSPVEKKRKREMRKMREMREMRKMRGKKMKRNVLNLFPYHEQLQQ
jgi:hypothetical protein